MLSNEVIFLGCYLILHEPGITIVNTYYFRNQLVIYGVIYETLVFCRFALAQINWWLIESIAGFLVRSTIIIINISWSLWSWCDQSKFMWSEFLSLCYSFQAAAFGLLPSPLVSFYFPLVISPLVVTLLYSTRHLTSSPIIWSPIICLWSGVLSLDLLWSHLLRSLMSSLFVSSPLVIFI